MSLSVLVDKVVFSGGFELELDAGDLLVVVGPNNAGKSALLNLIKTSFQNSHSLINSESPIGQVQLKKNGTKDDVLDWLNEHGEDTNGTFQLVTGSFNRTQQLNNFLNDRAFLGVFASLLTTSNRLNLVNPSKTGGQYTSAKKSLKTAFYNTELDDEIGRYFRSVFGKDLILQRVGEPEYYCTEPDEFARGLDCPVRELVENLPSKPRLNEQGDGMKSFVGVMLNLLSSPAFVRLIDEPESFLHPPQARILGSVIGKLASKEPGKQLAIATHSGDLLRGILESGHQKLKILRLTRASSGNSEVNHAKLLDEAAIQKLWNDPVLRFGNALDAVFHDACIICEYETDCQFYSAIADANSSNRPDSDLFEPDVMYVGSGGKGGIVKVVDALQALDVPIAVVADFDLLNNANPLSGILQSNGGDWEKIKSDINQLNQNINKDRQPLAKEQVQEKIVEIFNREENASLSSDSVSNIKELLRGISPWSEPKRLGLDYFTGQSLVELKRVISLLSESGVFPVPKGEMESFAREYRSGSCKGVKWLSKVFESEDLNTSPVLQDARQFVQQVVGWIKEQCHCEEKGLTQ